MTGDCMKWETDKDGDLVARSDRGWYFIGQTHKKGPGGRRVGPDYFYVGFRRRKNSGYFRWLSYGIDPTDLQQAKAIAEAHRQGGPANTVFKIMSHAVSGGTEDPAWAVGALADNPWQLINWRVRGTTHNRGGGD